MYIQKKSIIYAFITALLGFWGAIQYIVSSEFWPITISKTWLGFTPDPSVWQKPLLSLFLSIFHLVPLSDLQHILVVKFVFCLLGLLGVYLLSKTIVFLLESDLSEPSKIDPRLLFVGFFLFIPSLSRTFATVRSDTLAVFLFSLYCWFCFKKKSQWPLMLLALIPLAGIKESFYIIPGIIVFYYSNSHSLLLKKSFVRLTYLASIAIFVWLIALNENALRYLFDVVRTKQLGLSVLSSIETRDFVFIILSIVGVVQSWNYKKFRPFIYLSLYLIFVYFISPQKHDYFKSGLFLFSSAPLLLFVLSQYRTKTATYYLRLSPVIIFTVFNGYKEFGDFYFNLDQLQYISKTSQIFKDEKFMYLDGIGMYPRQKIAPCFPSPQDEVAANGCGYELQKRPDVIVQTLRLMTLPPEKLFDPSSQYEQLFPNFWLLKSKMNSDIKQKSQLSQLAFPIMLFR